MKSSNILYLFDFDGTLVGTERWLGVIKNWKLNFKSRVYINPHDYDIRWSVLTGRPKIDKFLIWLCCSIKGLFPKKIITHENFKFPFKNNEEKYIWKYSIISKILLDKQSKYIYNNNRVIEKIVYIDNDISTINFLNQHRSYNQRFIAINVSDFIKTNYSFLI